MKVVEKHSMMMLKMSSVLKRSILHQGSEDPARFFTAVLSAFLLVAITSSSAYASERQIYVKGEASALSMPIWVAKELRLFGKYGLNVDMVAITGGALGMKALLGGSIQFATNSPMAPINADLAGANLVFVGGVLNRSLYKIVAAKNDLQKPVDLENKRIGVTALGGANEFVVRMALREWKIPESSVKMLATGRGSSRIASVIAGGTDATVLPYDSARIAVDKGLHVVADLADIVNEFPDKMIIVQRSFLNQERDKVKRFMQALSDSIFVLRKGIQKERIVARFAKETRAKPHEAEAIYNTYHKIFSFPPRVGRKGMREVVEMMQQQKGREKEDFSLNRFIDESVIDELEHEGFFKKLESNL